MVGEVSGVLEHWRVATHISRFFFFFCVKVISQGGRIPSNVGQTEARVAVLEGALRQARQRLRTVLPAAGPVAWPGRLHRLPNYPEVCILIDRCTED